MAAATAPPVPTGGAKLTAACKIAETRIRAAVAARMRDRPSEAVAGPMATQIFGIVNITEDSFSDGGRFLAADAAIEQARTLWRAGAAAIDLGAAASNPDAIQVPPKEEIARLAPVIAALKPEGMKISVDTFAP
jgi:dihydropteroate synthase